MLTTRSFEAVTRFRQIRLPRLSNARLEMVKTPLPMNSISTTRSTPSTTFSNLRDGHWMSTEFCVGQHWQVNWKQYWIRRPNHWIDSQRLGLGKKLAFVFPNKKPKHSYRSFQDPDLQHSQSDGSKESNDTIPILDSSMVHDMLPKSVEPATKIKFHRNYAKNGAPCGSVVLLESLQTWCDGVYLMQVY